MNAFEVTQDALDAFQEIGNIAAGSALAALSRIMDESINEMIPVVKQIDTDQMIEVLNKEDEMSLGVLFPFEGDLSGILLFTCSESFVRRLLKVMINCEAGLREMNEYRRSLVKEVVNIMASSYFKAFSIYTGKHIRLLPAAMSIDMAGAIANEPVAMLNGGEEDIVCLESDFSFKNGDRNHIALVVRRDSILHILEALGISE